MPKGGQPDNGNARKGNANRVQWHGTVAQETLDAIRRLSHETGKSQSEVVDMWREKAELFDRLTTDLSRKDIWLDCNAYDQEACDLIDKIRQWKEQSQ